MPEPERIQYKFMIPAPLKEALEEAAHQSRRSLSAEIIARLTESFDPKAKVSFNDETLRPIAKAMARAFVDTLRVTVKKAKNSDLDFKEIEDYFERQLEGKTDSTPD
jgi:rRNA-processing protein FCF1